LDGEINPSRRPAVSSGNRARSKSWELVPPNGISRWVCTSTLPGITNRPLASITLAEFAHFVYYG
jgi:hypothetical protein